jgi:formylglycine-generating enzyme required for sulfatase activity
VCFVVKEITVIACRIALCFLVTIIASLFLLQVPAAPPLSAAQDGDKVIANSIGMKLTLIPAGKFVMGSPAAEMERDPEELQHEVTISKPFYMGVYEVTQKEYEKVVAKNPSHFKKVESDMPVDQVRWSEVVDFCSRLSNNADERKAGRVYRLPTEAEWEYACRAGTKTTFHFGDALSSKQTNFDGNFPFGGAAKGPNLQKPAKVGSYEPNPWGLYDMHGNVAEWCSDWYDPDYYKKSPAADPKGPAKGVVSTGFAKDYFRVLRGGCWLDEAPACRAAYRFRLQSTEPYRLVGFRVVCEVK